jgi:hypothetical protein
MSQRSLQGGLHLHLAELFDGKIKVLNCFLLKDSRLIPSVVGEQLNLFTISGSWLRQRLFFLAFGSLSKHQA